MTNPPNGLNEGDQYGECYLHAGLPVGYRVLYNAAKRAGPAVQRS